MGTSPTTFHAIYNQLPPPCIPLTLEGPKGSLGSTKEASKSFWGARGEWYALLYSLGNRK